jgi:pyrimidine-nucleoside phosphorylase
VSFVDNLMHCLGFAGGTIDKLESIPGYNTALSVSEFQSLVQSSVGCSIVSPTTSLCPADRKLYALRDVTATVSSIALQTASIMSKKIAEFPNYLVLDVKYGRASFHDCVDDATTLAHSMVATGEANGVSTTAFLTRMDTPIGRAVGNWLEVYECIQMMKTGRGTTDLLTLVCIQAAHMIKPRYPEMTWDQLVEKVLTMLESGAVYTKFRDMVAAQGGDVKVLDECLPNTAKFTYDIVAPCDGYLSNSLDALIVGQACVKLGAGRTNSDDDVDASAGIWWHVKVGEAVTKGNSVATLYTNLSESVLKEATAMVEETIQYSDEPITIPPIISHFVSKGGHIEEFTIPTCLIKLET